MLPRFRAQSEHGPLDTPHGVHSLTRDPALKAASAYLSVASRKRKRLFKPRHFVRRHNKANNISETTQITCHISAQTQIICHNLLRIIAYSVLFLKCQEHRLGTAINSPQQSPSQSPSQSPTQSPTYFRRQISKINNYIRKIKI